MNKLKIILRVIIFAIIGIILFLLITPIFVPKTIYKTILQGFYDEPKNTIDVVFIGDSSVYKGVSPLEIWKKHGITSYNYASPTQKMWDSYYSIKEVLKYQSPKVIVLSADPLFSDKAMKDEYKRHFYDNVPLSKNKIQAMLDTVNKISKKQLLTYVFPFFRFHSRWNELDSKDFTRAYENPHDPFKGFFLVNGEKPYKKGNYMKKKKDDKISKKAEKYLEKIKKLCVDNKIELLLVEFPSPNTWNETKHQEVTKWANQNDVTFVDMNIELETIGIDWNKDTEDAGTHLNIYGAEKVSEYIGNYLAENYQLKSHKEDSKYKQWDEDLNIYEQYKKEKK